MENGAEILADNVIVMQTDMEVIDAIGRREIRTRGEGTARVYQDGAAIQAVWKKESAESMLEFFDEQGIEIPLTVGVTWIEVVE